jgi:hypothetical protein
MRRKKSNTVHDHVKVDVHVVVVVDGFSSVA